MKYTIEEKRKIIEGYYGGHQIARDYLKPLNIKIPTFWKWVSRYRNKTNLIEVTEKVKSLRTNDQGTFTLSLKNKTLTFSINDLQKVMEVIDHD